MPSTSSRWRVLRCSCATSCSRYNGLRPGERFDLHRSAPVPGAHGRAAPRAEGLRVPPRHRRRAERRRAVGHADPVLRRPRSSGSSATNGRYLTQQRDTRQAEIVAEEATRAAVLPPEEMLAALKEWWEPLLRRGRIFREGVGGQRAVPHRRAGHGRGLPQGQGPRIRGGGVHLLVHDPRRSRLDEHPRPRDRLVELDLPVDAVRGRPQSASSTSSSRRSSSACRATASSTSRTGTPSSPTSPRTSSSRSGSCSDAARTCAPTSPRREDRGRRAHVQPSRLEVGSDQRASASPRTAIRSVPATSRQRTQTWPTPPRSRRHERSGSASGSLYQQAAAGALDRQPRKTRPRLRSRSLA